MFPFFGGMPQNAPKTKQWNHWNRVLKGENSSWKHIVKSAFKLYIDILLGIFLKKFRT